MQRTAVGGDYEPQPGFSCCGDHLVGANLLRLESCSQVGV